MPLQRIPGAMVSDSTIFNADLAFDGGALSGFRNAVINGNFDIWNRGASHSTAGYGSVDRWNNARVGTACTISRQAFALGQTDVPDNPTYFCRAVVSSVTGAANYSGLYHAIENVSTFASRTVTVSFWAKADATRSISIELTQFFGNGGSPSAHVTGLGIAKVSIGTTWQKVTLTATLPSISGKTLGTNADDWLGLLIWFDAGSNFNARTNTLGHQSGTFDIAQVQLEAGPVATPFERRPLATELNLCKRYGQWVPYNMFFYAAGALTLEVPISWHEMRKTPIVSALQIDPYTAQAAANNSQNYIQRPTPYGGSCTLTSITAGNAYVVGYRSWLDAEL